MVLSSNASYWASKGILESSWADSFPGGGEAMIRRKLPIIFLLFALAGHSGRLVVERRCNLKYFVPPTLISKVVFFLALTPVDGLGDLASGLTAGWDKTCPSVRRQQDPARFNGPSR